MLCSLAALSDDASPKPLNQWRLHPHLLTRKSDKLATQIITLTVIQ